MSISCPRCFEECEGVNICPVCKFKFVSSPRASPPPTRQVGFGSSQDAIKSPRGVQSPRRYENRGKITFHDARVYLTAVTEAELVRERLAQEQAHARMKLEREMELEREKEATRRLEEEQRKAKEEKEQREERERALAEAENAAKKEADLSLEEERLLTMRDLDRMESLIKEQERVRLEMERCEREVEVVQPQSPKPVIPPKPRLSPAQIKKLALPSQEKLPDEDKLPEQEEAHVEDTAGEAQSGVSQKSPRKKFNLFGKKEKDEPKKDEVNYFNY